MTRTILSERQCGSVWPAEVDPFDDDVDENGDWIAVPEVEVTSPENSYKDWMRPRFYRLGPTPRLGMTRDVSTPQGRPMTSRPMAVKCRLGQRTS